MKLEPNKFYTHKEGRSISTKEYVDTLAWGKVLIIEEVDHTGHGISCITENDGGHEKTALWTEIGKDEFMENFKSHTKRNYEHNNKVAS